MTEYLGTVIIIPLLNRTTDISARSSCLMCVWQVEYRASGVTTLKD
jgi:hypothetical protein